MSSAAIKRARTQRVERTSLVCPLVLFRSFWDYGLEVGNDFVAVGVKILGETLRGRRFPVVGRRPRGNFQQNWNQSEALFRWFIDQLAPVRWIAALGNNALVFQAFETLRQDVGCDCFFRLK